jgi:hypothetical protein
MTGQEAIAWKQVNELTKRIEDAACRYDAKVENEELDNEFREIRRLAEMITDRLQSNRVAGLIEDCNNYLGE